jgi:uncharacterized membrane protein YqjE
MSRDNQDGPTLGRLLRKTAATGLGLLRNRSELFLIELQEEKSRVIKLVIFGVTGLFLTLMTVLLVTGAIIYLVPEKYRLYAVGAFALLYFLGAIGSFLGVKSSLQHVPFDATLEQFKKDRELTEAFDE